MRFRIFFLPLLLFGCKSAQVSQASISDPINQIQLRILRALNISENRSSLSTGDDEILLLLYILEQRDTALQIQQQQKMPLYFDSTKTSYSLAETFQIDQSEADIKYFVAILVELDEVDSSSLIQQRLDDYVKTGAFLEGLNFVALDKLLEYDDFLGLQYVRLDAVNKGSEREFVFKGMQLFDKYDYRLSLKFQ